MVQIIRAEQIKMHHTVEQMLVILLPLLIAGVSLLLNPRYIYAMGMNFWYTFFYCIFVALSCALVNQKENKKLQYRNVYQMPVKLSKIWRGKIYMLVINTIISANVLGILVCVISYIASGEIENGLLLTMLGVNCVWLINLWQIPVYLFIAKFTGFYIPCVLAGLISIFGVIKATQSSWWVYPMSWLDRAMCTLVRYQPNGLPMTAESEYLTIGWGQIAAAGAASVLLFGVLTWITAVIFERRSSKC